ncbi:MAG TPA: urate hydroxylase PuuD [Candidatus Binatia bacterium]|nr:urate hydroxylase PuuD [Candidatus Binatia bacterium]
MNYLDPYLRWIHIIAGIVWIGHLYFFNFVNGPFQATMSGDVKKSVNPELLPRALWWFRWGAAWTWATGVLMALILFYHGRLALEGDADWSLGALIAILLTFGGFLVYDALIRSAAIADVKIKYAVGFVLIVMVMLIMRWADFSYRGTLIHIGALFGTIMAFNVWFRIWPAQQQIITAVKNGTPPDANLVAMAGLRSRHNTYLSVPLLFTMINLHTVTAFPDFVPREVGLGLVILIGWHVVWQLYKRAGNVKGF